MLGKHKNLNYAFYLLGVSIYCIGLLLISNSIGIYVSLFGLFFILLSIIVLLKQNPEPSEIINRITYIVVFIILLVVIHSFLAKVADSLMAAKV